MSACAGQVLIVDDSPVLSWQLQRQLLALRVTAATVDAAQALQRCDDASVVFVEAQLLQGNGFALARQLAVTCTVVLITGTGRQTDLQWGLRTGARAVLTRPVQATALQQLLSTLLHPAGG